MNVGQPGDGTGPPSLAPDVVVLEDVWGPGLQELARELQLVRVAAEDPGELAAALAGARAVVVRNRTQITRSLLEACPTLLIVARAGVGLDNIDVGAADALGIVVSAARGANAASVAEHALALALALARGIVTLDGEVRAGGWERRPGRELAGGTWGLLGAGATGQACARLARGLGMHVVAFDPMLARYHPEMQALGITFAELDEVLASGDVVSCHLPATADTHGLIDAGRLAVMRPHALLVNVGRGEVIDEDALADALEAGRLGGAGLDVRASEPPRPGRLEAMQQVVLTPHVAGRTGASQTRILEMVADAIRAALAGKPTPLAVGAVRVPRRRRAVTGPDSVQR